MKKKLIIYLVIALVVLIIVIVVGKNQGWIGKSDLLKVAVEPATERSIIESFIANGKIQPETEVKISPDVSGEIVELYVQEGDEVEKGKLLLKIKEDIYISYLERAKAAVNSSKANYASSKARFAQTKASNHKQELAFNRSKKLYKQKAISVAEYENANASFEMAKADLEASQESVNAAKYSVRSAEASLKEARENLQKTSIYAPISGTVSRLNVEKGERVVGTIQMAGTEILRIANLNVMEVKVDVNENDIVSVNLYDTAIIEVDAYLKEKFKGLVTEIANSANVLGMSSDQVTNFEVKIRILSSSYNHLITKQRSYPFRPGMSASVDIQTKYETGILTIPIQAVTTRADTIKSDTTLIDKKNDEEVREVVFLYADGKVKIQEVETGIQDDTYIEITEGLSKGDEVVTAPYSAISRRLKDDKKVDKVDKSELFKKD